MAQIAPGDMCKMYKPRPGGYEGRKDNTMTKCKGITLGQLLDVCGCGTILHIAADQSNGWAFTGPASRAVEEMSDWAGREIVELYQHDGRVACPTCCKLDPGLAIVVEGYNDKGKAV